MPTLSTSEIVRDQNGRIIINTEYENAGEVVDMRDFGAVPDNETDCSPAIQRAVDQAPDGSTIYMPVIRGAGGQAFGSYGIYSGITINNKTLRLTGDAGTIGLNGTRLARKADVTALTISGTSAALVGGFQLENLQIAGNTSYTTDAVRASFQILMRWRNVNINNTGGNGLYLKECWDCDYYSLFIRNAGKYAANKAGLYLEGPEIDNINTQRFWGGHFEHCDWGQLVIAAAPFVTAPPGMFNDQIDFIGCKFESSGRPAGSAAPIALTDLSHSALSDCHFSIYSISAGVGRMMDVTRCFGLKVTGTGNNNVAPARFAEVVDSVNTDIELRGFQVGDVNYSGGSRGGERDVADTTAPFRRRRFLLDFPLLQNIGARLLAAVSNTCLDDANSPSGAALRLTATPTTGATILTRGLGGNTSQVGVTLSIVCRLADGSAGGSNFTVELTNGATTVTLLTFTPTTSYATQQVSIPRQFVNASTLIRVKNGTSTEVLLIGAISVRQGLWGAPVTGLPYEVGELLWATAPAAGGSPGQVCTTAGTGGSSAVFKAMANLAA